MGIAADIARGPSIGLKLGIVILVAAVVVVALIALRAIVKRSRRK